jgi:hypothetical protein
LDDDVVVIDVVIEDAVDDVAVDVVVVVDVDVVVVVDIGSGVVVVDDVFVEFDVVVEDFVDDGVVDVVDDVLLDVISSFTFSVPGSLYSTPVFSADVILFLYSTPFSIFLQDIICSSDSLVAIFISIPLVDVSVCCSVSPTVFITGVSCVTNIVLP